MVAAELPRTRRGAHETIAITLLLVGGFLAGVGWLVGVVLLWLSDVWSLRDKLLGTLVVPGGLAVALYLALMIDVSSGSRAVASCFFILLVAATIMVAVHLARTSRPPA